MRIVFFGSPQNAADLVFKLNQDPRFNIAGIVTQPDRPVGRRQILTATPVAQYAVANKIPLIKPRRNPEKKQLLLNPQEVKTFVLQLKPTLLIIYEFGQLIPGEIIKIAPLGGLNIHFSLLPKYRGAAPVPWQIANGEKETGISVTKISSKIDEGSLVYQEKQSIYPDDTTLIIEARLANRVLELLPKIIIDYASGKIKTKPQKGKSSYYPRLTREDSYVLWKDFLKAEQGNYPKIAGIIERKIRAFNPWPGVWTYFSGEKNKRLKIISANIKEGKLIPQKIQFEGKKIEDWKL